MKNALRVGIRAGVRTFAQLCSGGLGSIVLLGVALPELKNTAAAVLTVFLAALLGGLTAGLQNFAEAIPEQ